jgi:hypothetical protein
MRVAVMGLLVLLGACGTSEEERAAADRAAAKSGFVPPSVMSRIDYGSRQERRFRRLDHDADDVLTEAEIPAPFRARLMPYDKDKDGDISLTEFSEGSLARFDAVDLNRDGTVTSEEMKTAGQRL